MEKIYENYNLFKEEFKKKLKDIDFRKFDIRFDVKGYFRINILYFDEDFYKHLLTIINNIAQNLQIKMNEYANNKFNFTNSEIEKKIDSDKCLNISLELEKMITDIVINLFNKDYVENKIENYEKVEKYILRIFEILDYNQEIIKIYYNELIKRKDYKEFNTTATSNMFM